MATRKFNFHGAGTRPDDKPPRRHIIVKEHAGLHRVAVASVDGVLNVATKVAQKSITSPWERLVNVQINRLNRATNFLWHEHVA